MYKTTNKVIINSFNRFTSKCFVYTSFCESPQQYFDIYQHKSPKEIPLNSNILSKQKYLFKKKKRDTRNFLPCEF